MKTQSDFSLLWPQGKRPLEATYELDPNCVRDLGLENTLRAFSQDSSTQKVCGQILLNLCTDPAIIRYRQQVLEDLLQHPQLTTRLEVLIPQITALDLYRDSVDRRRQTLQEITWRLSELEQFVEVVTALNDVFAEINQEQARLRSGGWQQLAAVCQQTAQDVTFQNLAEELPDLLSQLREHVSVTIGVNLDKELRPIAATLVSVNTEVFTTSSFVDRLFGKDGEGLKGIGPLHTVPQIGTGGIPSGIERSRHGLSPLMVPLFKDLAKVLEKVSQPIAKALRQYTRVNAGFLGRLRNEIVFYLAAVDLIQRLEAQGLPMCQPEIAPLAERVCQIEECFNLNLAAHLLHTAEGVESLVKNKVAMGENGRIFILTGPNRGGKTTFTQMAGLCQVMAQAGLHVPGSRATISPVDGIFTHYPVEEQLEKGTGRFGDEAQRFSHIFKRATRHSLVLLNESLSSTSPGESLYLAQDIVRILRRMGGRAIFGTHMHALAASADELNAEIEGDSKIVSLIALLLPVEEGGQTAVRRSYKIVPGPPMGRSYASEIAQKYGISYTQLVQMLNKRGVLD